MNILFSVAAMIVLCLSSESAMACSRLFWNDNGKAMVVARTMDLFRGDHAKFVIFPRGITRDGLLGEEANSVKWTSKYGSAAVTAFDKATSDGMNEKGLAANLLYLGPTQYEKRSGKPGVSNVLWVQYILDNFSTVKEVLADLPNYQVASLKVAGREWPLHLAIEDATGDSAVLEFVDGKLVVHHGKQYRVMTNEPAFDVQLANLKKYKLFGGTLAMPGDVDPLSRFIRASSFLKTLPKPDNMQEAIAGVYGVARTIAVPFGAKDTSGEVSETSGGGDSDAWPTLWFTLADLTNKVYYFQSTKSPNLYWVEFDKLKLAPGSPTLTVDAYDSALSGDIAGRMAAAK